MLESSFCPIPPLCYKTCVVFPGTANGVCHCERSCPRSVIKDPLRVPGNGKLLLSVSAEEVALVSVNRNLRVLPRMKSSLQSLWIWWLSRRRNNMLPWRDASTMITCTESCDKILEKWCFFWLRAESRGFWDWRGTEQMWLLSVLVMRNNLI